MSRSITMNDIESACWEFDRTIPSDPNEACALIRETICFLEDHHWSNADVFGIHMALEEAIMNSIKHGNKRDADKKVKIHVQVFANRFLTTISDEGDGFDLDAVPDPTQDENVEKTSGRGVMLIRQFMDEVRYELGGRQVCMCKNRS